MRLVVSMWLPAASFDTSADVSLRLPQHPVREGVTQIVKNEKLSLPWSISAFYADSAEHTTRWR